MISEIIIIFYILMGIFILNLIIVGIFILIKSIQKGMTNLLFLGLASLLIAIGFIGNYVLNLGILFEETLVISSFILVCFYTKLTFYKKTENKNNVVLFFIIILAIIQYCLIIVNISNTDPVFWYLEEIVDAIVTFLTFGWMGFSSFKAYRRLKAEEIEPWVKTRYKLLAISAIVLSFQAIPEIFVPVGSQYGDPELLINLIVFFITIMLALIFSLGHLIAWMMPKRMKEYLNNDYQKVEDGNVSEQKLIELIKKQLGKNNL